MIVRKLSSQEWKTLAEDAHVAVFSELWDKELERVSFAYVILNDETPVAYTTCKIIDPTTLYLEYGGVFPPFKKSILAARAFDAMLAEATKEFSTIKTYVENTNKPMLRLYNSSDFLITGLRYFKTLTLLEHTYES